MVENRVRHEPQPPPEDKPELFTLNDADSKAFALWMHQAFGANLLELTDAIKKLPSDDPPLDETFFQNELTTNINKFQKDLDRLTTTKELRFLPRLGTEEKLLGWTMEFSEDTLPFDGSLGPIDSKTFPYDQSEAIRNAMSDKFRNYLKYVVGYSELFKEGRINTTHEKVYADIHTASISIAEKLGPFLDSNDILGYSVDDEGFVSLKNQQHLKKGTRVA